MCVIFIRYLIFLLFAFYIININIKKYWWNLNVHICPFPYRTRNLLWEEIYKNAKEERSRRKFCIPPQSSALDLQLNSISNKDFHIMLWSFFAIIQLTYTTINLSYCTSNITRNRLVLGCRFVCPTCVYTCMRLKGMQHTFLKIFWQSQKTDVYASKLKICFLNESWEKKKEKIDIWSSNWFP